MPQADPCLLQPGQTVAFDGDSLTCRRQPPALDTWPFLQLMNWRDTYAEHVSQWLFCVRPELNLTFRNVAVGGSSCRELLDRLDGQLLPLRPDWVILTVGANDQAREIPLEEFGRSMRRYAGAIAEASGGRCLFVGGFQACPHAPDHMGARCAEQQPYYRELAAVAAEHDGIYLDAGSELHRKAEVLYEQSSAHTVYSDGCHFNAVGSRIVAAEVLRALGAVTF